MSPAARRELYISVDIEASGPIPAEYNMLSLGAAVVGETSRNFYVELAPLNDNATPEAMATCQLSLAELRARGVEPRAAMQQFAEWVRATAGEQLPIFCGFNAAFDWSFVNYYFIRFLGLGANPFGHVALDLKSYYMGAYRTTFAATSMKRLPPELHPPDQPLAHNALSDAIQQAEILERLFEHNSSA